MVRHATSQVIASALPCANRLEILIAQARLRHTPTGLDPSEESLLTVLLSFDPTAAERRAARVLAATFIAADCSFWQPPAAAELSTWIAGTLHKLPTSSACVVVALPDYSRGVEQQIGAAIDTIRVGYHEVGLIVGVATAPAAWAGCGFDGFVIVESGRRASDALRVFSALAAIMAPGLMPCLDADDFRCALGTAAYPSRIAEAVYFLSSSCLRPVDRIDQQAMSDAVAAAVMPSRCLRPATQALLVKRVRARVRPDAALTVVGPWGLTVEPLGSSNSTDVLLICSIIPQKAVSERGDSA